MKNTISSNEYLKLLERYINRIEAEREVIRVQYLKNGNLNAEDGEKYTTLTNLLNRAEEKLIVFEYLKNLIDFKSDTEKVKKHAEYFGNISSLPYLFAYEVKYRDIIKDFEYLIACQLKNNNIVNFTFKDTTDIKDKIIKSNKDSNGLLTLFIYYYEQMSETYFKLLEDIDVINNTSNRALSNSKMIEDILTRSGKNIDRLIKYFLKYLYLELKEYQTYFAENKGLSNQTEKILTLYKELNNSILSEDNTNGRK